MKKPIIKVSHEEVLAGGIVRCLITLGEGSDERMKYLSWDKPLPQKIYPPTMTFEQALRSGNTGRILCDPYLRWLKTLPCDTCGAGAPSDPSHFNSLKGAGTKAADLLALPHCRSCHERYERGPAEYVPSIREDEVGPPFLSRVAIYHVQAFFEGRLVWVEG